MGRPMNRAALVAAMCLAIVGGPVDSAGAPAANGSQTADCTPAAWLKGRNPPAFREGHTLPPLTRFGWTLPLDARIELAERWGYGLEFGGYATTKAVDKALSDPESDGGRMLALAAKAPKTYRLCVICARDLPEKDVPPRTWTRDAEGRLLDAKARSMDGTEWHKGMKTVYSPASPDSVWKEAGRLRADPIRRIRERCPIAIVLNGGEYGLGVLGFARKVWEQDPAVLEAKGETPWFDYISERKAHQERIIADAVRAAARDALLYIYYPTSGGTHRNRSSGWKAWCYGYEWMKPVSDLASTEAYYRHFNSGWTGKQDLLTMVLNARGFEIAQGQPLSYNWLSAGWPRKMEGDEGLADLDRYEGFLKCFYTAGMLGGNAGYYAYPKGGFKALFPKDEPPHWLRQMVVLSRVHALFSNLEEYLRNGDLLPGPDKHVWSKDQPAYEYPTGDAAARIVARKHRQRAEWLVTAWAAGGEAREVRAAIPGLGEVALRARPNGSVYRVTLDDGRPRCRQVDEGR
jgi:hypothetical protein